MFWRGMLSTNPGISSTAARPRPGTRWRRVPPPMNSRIAAGEALILGAARSGEPRLERIERRILAERSGRLVVGVLRHNARTVLAMNCKKESPRGDGAPDRETPPP